MISAGSVFFVTQFPALVSHHHCCCSSYRKQLVLHRPDTRRVVGCRSRRTCSSCTADSH